MSLVSLRSSVPPPQACPVNTQANTAVTVVAQVPETFDELSTVNALLQERRRQQTRQIPGSCSFRTHDLSSCSLLSTINSSNVGSSTRSKQTIWQPIWHPLIRTYSNPVSPNFSHCDVTTAWSGSVAADLIFG